MVFIADIYKTPMVAIKAIIDVVEPEIDTAAKFVANSQKATTALGGALVSYWTSQMVKVHQTWWSN